MFAIECFFLRHSAIAGCDVEFPQQGRQNRGTPYEFKCDFEVRSSVWLVIIGKYKFCQLKTVNSVNHE